MGTVASQITPRKLYWTQVGRTFSSLKLPSKCKLWTVMVLGCPFSNSLIGDEFMNSRIENQNLAQLAQLRKPAFNGRENESQSQPVNPSCQSNLETNFEPLLDS